MSDVEAMKHMANDRDLEFVDLDTYGVDPAAGSILPTDLSRYHHVVAVKRKFGTPVIATADPEDLFAQDSIRALLGRDFISVVAAPEQIDAYIELMFGGGKGSPARSGETEGVPDAPPTVDALDQALAEATEAGDALPALAPPDAPFATLVADTSAVPAWSDELAAGTRSFDATAILDNDPGGSEPSDDSAPDAADLVAEAVASFRDLHPEAADASGAARTASFPPLAKALVDGGRVTLEAMSSALEEHQLSGLSIARILTDQKLVTEADLMWGMAEEMGLDFVDLDTMGVDQSMAGMLPESTARHHNVMVVGSDNGIPVVAASNPTDVFALDDLRTIMGRNFIVVVATRSQISAYIGRVFNSGGDAADMAMEASLGMDGSRPDNGVDDIQSVTEEAPIVRYVNLLILQALNERASDIHIEPTATDLRIRYRIDGVLHDVSTAPRTIAAAVTTRLKVMADMNIAEHRVPQDGRISLNVGAKGIDLRMATLPTIHGEKVVMRVLDKSSVVLGFADLGFGEEMLSKYEGLYTKPYGTILVTGPTGSGKSTTLYTTLTALNSPEKNIITVEDPVELPLKGVNQVQLNLKAGLNFASALRAILRSDPDIVLVGEIRDKETASIAIEAALTGHMVLATLHTNNAASTPMRLIEMGIEPFLVTSSLSGVLAQRLVRRLCTHCKEAYEPTEEDIAAAGWSPAEVEAVGGMPIVYRSVGCSACSNTGYRGRKALAELLPMTEEVERMIIEGGSVDEIHRLAVSQGMCTLRQSGLHKAFEGETTLEEVLRVVA
jgi:type IV pilus assembly protein PilB